ncbi:hypothetical protein KEM56_006124, partial [Ascosphaera pollenicola]
RLNARTRLGGLNELLKKSLATMAKNKYTKGLVPLLERKGEAEKEVFESLRMVIDYYNRRVAAEEIEAELKQ